MRYTRMIEGYEGYAEVDFRGVVSFGSPMLEGRSFDSETKLEDALHAYDLKLRKDFSNRIAYTEDRYGTAGITEVEVTSIDGDEAWTKTKAGRSKRRVGNLFADKEELAAAIAAEAAARERFKDEVAAIWAKPTRWTPIKGAA